MSMTNSSNRVEVITSVQRRRALGGFGEGSDGRGDLRARHDGEPGGALAWGCTEPAVHLASAGGARPPDCGWQRRRGCAGLRLSSAAEPGSRASSPAWQEKRLKPRFSRRRWSTPRAKETAAGVRRRNRAAHRRVHCHGSQASKPWRGEGLETVQSQAGLSRDEKPRPLARPPCRRD